MAHCLESYSFYEPARTTWHRKGDAMGRLSFILLAVLLAAPFPAAAQSNPFDGLNSRGVSPYADPAVYAKHKEQWLARVQALPENVDVLEGAADFFMILDRPLAQGLLERQAGDGDRGGEEYAGVVTGEQPGRVIR